MHAMLLVDVVSDPTTTKHATIQQKTIGFIEKADNEPNFATKALLGRRPIQHRRYVATMTPSMPLQL
jgi:hypothetical protein